MSENNTTHAAPVSPAPVGDMDAAVEAACRAYERPDFLSARRDDMQAALTAALPHLPPCPAPVADREDEQIDIAKIIHRTADVTAPDANSAADALIEAGYRKVVGK